MKPIKEFKRQGDYAEEFRSHIKPHLPQKEEVFWKLTLNIRKNLFNDVSDQILIQLHKRVE